MSTFIKAALVTLILNAGITTAYAGAYEDAVSAYEDAVSKGQIMHPNGTAGSK